VLREQRENRPLHRDHSSPPGGIGKPSAQHLSFRKAETRLSGSPVRFCLQAAHRHHCRAHPLFGKLARELAASQIETSTSSCGEASRTPLAAQQKLLYDAGVRAGDAARQSLSASQAEGSQLPFLPFLGEMRGGVHAGWDSLAPTEAALVKFGGADRAPDPGAVVQVRAFDLSWLPSAWCSYATTGCCRRRGCGAPALVRPCAADNGGKVRKSFVTLAGAAMFALLGPAGRVGAQRGYGSRASVGLLRRPL
jgi:hypothetical protein